MVPGGYLPYTLGHLVLLHVIFNLQRESAFEASNSSKYMPIFFLYFWCCFCTNLSSGFHTWPCNKVVYFLISFLASMWNMSVLLFGLDLSCFFLLIYYASTSLSCVGIQQWKSVLFHCWATMNLVGEMSSEEDPHYPLTGHQQLKVEVTWGMRRTHPLSTISSWELKWHEEDPPPVNHQELRVEVTWAMRRTFPTPHWLAINSWSDMSSEEDPPYPPLTISTWELKWHEQWGGPNLLPCWLSGVESWSNMSNEEDLPYLPIGWPSTVEVTWAVRRTNPTPIKTSYCSAGILRPWGGWLLYYVDPLSSRSSSSLSSAAMNIHSLVF